MQTGGSVTVQSPDWDRQITHTWSIKYYILFCAPPMNSNWLDSFVVFGWTKVSTSNTLPTISKIKSTPGFLFPVASSNDRVAPVCSHLLSSLFAYASATPSTSSTQEPPRHSALKYVTNLIDWSVELVVGWPSLTVRRLEGCNISRSARSACFNALRLHRRASV